MTLPGMRLRNAVLLGLLASGVAEAAALTLVGGPAVVCPGGTGSVSVFLINFSGAPQRIPDGTTITLAFSLPVAGPLGIGGTANTTVAPGGIQSGFSGNTATLTFRESTVMLGDSFFGFSSTLNLQGIASGAPIWLTIASSPAGAIIFPGSGNTAVVGIADFRACRPAPSSTFTSDDLIAVCPSAQEVSAFNRAVTINFESDPSRDTLVCRAADGSADLTRLQERTYQALRLMQRIPADAPLPWTSLSLYDWFTGTVRGIRFRGDISVSFCCDPAGVINIQTNLAVLHPDLQDPATVASLMALLLHEARHIQTGPHTCGLNDQTLTELGAWGVQYYVYEWMAFRSGDFFTAKATSRRPPSDYHSMLWGQAKSVSGGQDNGSICGSICDVGPGVVASPRRLDFGAQAVGSASVSKTVAITATKGGPTRLTSVTLSGPNAADFTLADNACAGATVPMSCVALVSFRPSASGPRTASLVVTFGSPAVTQTVELSGTGSGNAACSFSITPSAQDFPAQGGPGSVSVTAPSACGWAAASSTDWITFTSLRTGAGNGTVAYTVTPNLRTTARQATLTIAGQAFGVTQAASPRPAISQNAVVNAASFQPGIASATWVAIQGLNLAPTTRTWRESDFVGRNLPAQLEGVSVNINGRPAYVSYISPTQINVLAPDDSALGPVSVEVITPQGKSDVVLAQKQPFAPAFFMFDPQTRRYAAAVHVDGTFVGKPDLFPGFTARPARPGETIAVFGTGFGPTDPFLPAALVPGLPARLANQVAVRLGDRVAGVPFAGLVTPGLYQFNITIPDLPNGDYPIVAEIQGLRTQATALITVERE